MKALLLLALLPGAAMAQSIVGRAMIEGRTAALYADGTWSYESGGTCRTLARGLEFCDDSGRWAVTIKVSPDAAATFRHSERFYGQQILENLGTDNGLTAEAVRAFVLSSAASGEQPIMIAVEPADYQGLQAETVTYVMTLFGLQATFANTLVLDMDRVLQIQTWESGTTEYNEDHRKVHEEFVTATKLEDRA